MIRVGLMGDIGSGKSFVAKLFSCPVFDADREVNILYKNSRECFSKLKKKLPNFIQSFPIKKSELLTAINHDNKNLIKIVLSIFIGALIIFVCGIAHLSGFIGIEKSINAGLYPFIYSELLKIALAISLTYLLIKKN